MELRDAYTLKNRLLEILRNFNTLSGLWAAS